MTVLPIGSMVTVPGWSCVLVVMHYNARKDQYCFYTPSTRAPIWWYPGEWIRSGLQDSLVQIVTPVWGFHYNNVVRRSVYLHMPNNLATVAFDC